MCKIFSKSVRIGKHSLGGKITSLGGGPLKKH
jgi:hypothetical protein